jgi:hypothetical protein
VPTGADPAVGGTRSQRKSKGNRHVISLRPLAALSSCSPSRLLLPVPSYFQFLVTSRARFLPNAFWTTTLVNRVPAARLPRHATWVIALFPPT